jgi:hypothetical protein
MQGAIKLLFATNFNGKPLFSSQLDLVTALLSTPDSKYSVSESHPELYAKAQNRLKAYVSQILSLTASRNVTEEFVTSLTAAVSSRLNQNPIEANKVVTEVINAVREKNTAISKAEIKTTPLEQFIGDIESARYISVITSRPLEIEVEPDSTTPSLRVIIFSDLLSQLADPTKELKTYRFNFPTESFGDLFWRGFRRILLREFRRGDITELFQMLRKKLGLDIPVSQELNDDFLKQLVHITLLALNQSKHVLVFTTQAPVYGLPIIAIDPSDISKSKVYSILDSEKMTLLKFPDNETLLWRLFVWDQLKSNNYSGKPNNYHGTQTK